jgi:L-ribulose-5-phosphate 3-epimerase UlaE
LIDGCYKVSDQVPAGLKIMPEKITDSINQITPYQNDTKTINFCIYPNQTGLSTIKINYFAKAFSAGGFNVQSATIENLKSDSSLNLSPKQTVEIN